MQWPCYGSRRSVISLHNICKSYDDGATFVVRDLSLTIERGELVVLLGESGCGKTTTLKLINRLVDCTSGTIEVAGNDVLTQDPVALRRRIGYVFQGVGLFPHRTVAENIGTVPRLLQWPADKIDKRVDELLALMKLAPDTYRGRSPTQLSGGQRQRVGVARALAAKPDIVLMDEPFGALDPITRDNLQHEYRRVHEQLGLTTVLVTHDIMEALTMADRIAVMQDGAIAQLGTPHTLLTAPSTEYVAELMKKPRQQADAIEALIGDGA